jgi:hypothetical protein
MNKAPQAPVYKRSDPWYDNIMSKTNEIYLTDEHYAALHKMVCDQLEAILGPYDNIEGFEPTAEQQTMLDAVTAFSAQLPFRISN